jgi:alpha-tubulin suppressor-like RCC1 family protein
MAIVTEAGDVWCWGMEQGLGLCPGVRAPGSEGGDYLFPVRIAGQRNPPFDASVRCEEVACGAAHTVVSVNRGGALFAWGRGQNGVLGTGKMDDSPTPCRVVWPPVVDATDNREDVSASIAVSQLPKIDGDPADEELAIARKEISALKAELAAAKEQASALHAGLYGTLGSINAYAPATRAAFQEWDRLISAASYEELSRLDSFYRQARSRVKEILLEKQVERLCKKLMGER